MYKFLKVLKSPSFWLFVLFLISMLEYLWNLQIGLYGPGINIMWGAINISLLYMIIF